MKSTQVNQDATIQRFEFCFELSWKLMKEYVREEGTPCNSPKSCIWEAGQLGFVDDVEQWIVFLEARNSVARMYNATMARSVYDQACKFPKCIDEILLKLN